MYVFATHVLRFKDMIGRMFFHGPGGSGKTYMLTKVVLPVYNAYLPSSTRGVAAQNSAARLIGGCTFHYMAGLTRSQDLVLKAPTKKRMTALTRRWARLALLFADVAWKSQHTILVRTMLMFVCVLGVFVFW